MKSYCLASSSSGNCYVLEFKINGMPTRIMVECGISISEIYKKLGQMGILLSSIQACLITHAHKDHCMSASHLQMLGIPIFASKDTLEKISCKGNELIPLEPKRVLNGLFVMGFKVEHDIEGALGFIIKTKDECVFFANDHKMWEDNLTSFKPNYVFIECNYDHKTVYAQYGELKKLKKQTEDEKELKEIDIKLQQHERNINSHCSLAGTIRGLQKLDLSRTICIFLMHLSDRYANEFLMKNTIQSTFKIKTLVCNKNGGSK